MNFELIALKKSDLACKLAQKLNKPLHIAGITRFADGEIEVNLPGDLDLSNTKAYVIHSTCPPVHENIIQALLLAVALRNVGATEIIGVMPYFGYARHDKSKISGGRAPVEAIIKSLENVGYTKIITVELHAPHVLELFAVPVINIALHQLLADIIKKNHGVEGVCLVAPDKGAVHRVEAVAALLSLPVIYFTKERVGPDRTKIITHQAQCVGKTAIVIDDMIDSGGTAIGVCNELKAMGFNSVVGYFVHPVLSGNAVQKIEASAFDRIYVSNSIDLKVTSPKIEIFDISTQRADFLP